MEVALKGGPEFAEPRPAVYGSNTINPSSRDHYVPAGARTAMTAYIPSS